MFEIIGNRGAGKTLKLFSLIEETHYLKGIPYKDMVIVVPGPCDYMKEKFFKVTGTHVDFFTPSRFLRLSSVDDIKESHIFVDEIGFLFTEASRRPLFNSVGTYYSSFLHTLKEKLYGYTIEDYEIASAYIGLGTFPDIAKLDIYLDLHKGPLLDSFKHFSKDTFETIWLTRNPRQANSFNLTTREISLLQ